MAIARGAGTEIIRTVHMQNLANTARVVIFGVQHHIYTVLSVVVHAAGLGAAGNWAKMTLLGYDIDGGTSAATMTMFQQDMQVGETFVWNDKFSFNGHEPVDFTATLDSIAKQDAIADQGSAVVQKLYIAGEGGSDNFDVTVTYIDQNNA